MLTVKNVHGLSTKEECFLYWYAKMGKTQKQAAIMAGYPNKSAQATAQHILKKKKAKQYIDKVMKTVEHKLNWEFEDKLRKLKKVADLAIPDDAKSMEEISHQAGISAIAESNKMQGHYSAEKIVQTNVNVDADLQQVAALLKEYKREY